jgi:hypothetical protein
VQKLKIKKTPAATPAVLLHVLQKMYQINVLIIPPFVLIKLQFRSSLAHNIIIPPREIEKLCSRGVVHIIHLCSQQRFPLAGSICNYTFSGVYSRRLHISRFNLINFPHQVEK